MPRQRVLICGAGVAGSILAYWLAQSDFDVLVVERSRASQKTGQGIEIEEPALAVVRAMGVMDDLEACKTGELGFELLDEQDTCHGRLPTGDFSPTGNLELMRGDLVEVLYRAADKMQNVKYEFETSITSLEQDESRVTVELDTKRGASQRREDFDFVIGADGVKSTTRRLLMGSDEALKCYKQVGAYVAWFSIPKERQDWPYSRLCHFPGRRILWMRPIGHDSEMTSVCLIHLKDFIPELHEANDARDRNRQKEIQASIYAELGWEMPRVLEQMHKADNFYSDELQQVKLESWSKGRVALVGDAAWAPTPFTGEGNQLAIIGAWVLAQEMTRHRSTLAFQTFEARLRKHVESCQDIPLNGYAPYIFNPETSLGIWVLRKVFRLTAAFVTLLTWTGLGKYMPSGKPEYFDLQM